MPSIADSYPPSAQAAICQFRLRPAVFSLQPARSPISRCTGTHGLRNGERQYPGEHLSVETARMPPQFVIARRQSAEHRVKRCRPRSQPRRDPPFFAAREDQLQDRSVMVHRLVEDKGEHHRLCRHHLHRYGVLAEESKPGGCGASRLRMLAEDRDRQDHRRQPKRDPNALAPNALAPEGRLAGD
jgi:hypothetical protein